MKLGRPLVEGLDGLVCWTSRVLLELGQAHSRPAAAVCDGGQRLLRNLDESVHFHWFFSGADLLCMPVQTEWTGDASGIAVQARAPLISKVQQGWLWQPHACDPADR